jgi:hypothetical protein
MMSKEARQLFLSGGGEEALQAWKVRISHNMQMQNGVHWLCVHHVPLIGIMCC